MLAPTCRESNQNQHCCEGGLFRRFLTEGIADVEFVASSPFAPINEILEVSLRRNTINLLKNIGTKTAIDFLFIVENRAPFFASSLSKSHVLLSEARFAIRNSKWKGNKWRRFRTATRVGRGK